MSTSLQFSPILCCITLYLLLIENVHSLKNISSHHDYYHHQPPSKKFKLPMNISYLSQKERKYKMDVSDGYTPKNYRKFYTVLQRNIVSIRTARATAYFGDNHICAGSIISDDLILTAAHCVIDRRKIVTRSHRIMVVGGTPNRLNPYVGTVEIKVLDVIPHHDFVPDGAHDIALLRLADSFRDDNDFIRVIPLSDGIIPNGTICTIIGWGQMFYRGPISGDAIHGAMIVFSYSYCHQFYPNVFDETMMCASRADAWDVNTCRGDAGGPLICGGRIAGVVSWRSYCGRDTKPTVFASVYHHRDWIKRASCANILKSLKILHLLLYMLCIYILK
ncbi:trypsin-2 [Bactrocera dorsalis]|uniref:Trypsin-2 n=1 Tax=Bactrocera dorsalis TaxID=27457 RepID=A0A6I9V4D5_BACDO|nr:trypsin-2 [Bactrocera dorsalis]